MRPLKSKLAILTCLFFVLGMMPWVNALFGQWAATASASGSTCESVTSSVYVAVYSHDTGLTSCYMNDQIDLSSETGSKFDIAIVSNKTSIYDRAVLEQGDSVTNGAFVEGKFVFPNVSPEHGNQIYVNLFPFSTVYQPIRIKPHGNIVFEPIVPSEINYDINLVLPSLPAGYYDIGFSSSIPDYREVTLINGTARFSKYLDEGVSIYRNVSIKQDGHVYLTIDGSESDYDDTYYIGYVPENKSLIKVYFVNYDEEFTQTDFQVQTVDNVSLNLNAQFESPESNVLFFQQDRIPGYELLSTSPGTAFPFFWEHKISVDVTLPGEDVKNHLITSHWGHSIPGYRSDTITYDYSEWETVRVVPKPPLTTLPQLKVYQPGGLSIFAIDYAYTNVDGIATFVESGCRECSGYPLYTTISPFDPSGYSPSFVQSRALQYDESELAYYKLEVGSLKRLDTTPGESFNLKDLAWLGLNFNEKLQYDADGNGTADIGDLQMITDFMYFNVFTPGIPILH